jgi:hypothetical protein
MFVLSSCRKSGWLQGGFKNHVHPNMFMSTYKKLVSTPACFVEQYPMPLSKEHNTCA